MHISQSELAPVAQAHTLAPTFSIADLLVAYLAKLDIDTVFGVPGGAIEPMYNALARHIKADGPIQQMVARHEAGAVYMADGYARQSGKFGVCLSTSGPGATNMLTAVATAKLNNIPLLVITGQPALAQNGRHALQESGDTGIDVVAMMKYCSHYSTLVSHPDQFEFKLMAALHAMRFHSGPVHLSFPADILRAQAAVPVPSYKVAWLLENTPVVDLQGIDTVAALLEPQGRAIVLIGAGCVNAMPAVMQYVERTLSPFIVTPDGLGLINPHHPLFHGVVGYGGHASADAALRDPHFKFVIAAGVSGGDWNPDGWNASLLQDRVIHLDADDEHLARSSHAQAHVRGDIGAAFAALAALVPYYQYQGGLSGLRWGPVDMLDDPIAFKSDATPLKPQRMMNELGRLMPPDATYFADPGHSMAWATHYLHPQPNQLHDNEKRPCGAWLHVTTQFAQMGWAIGAAVGAAAANPNATAVCITGDGAMLLSGQELSTAVHEKLCVVFVVLNDCSLGIEQYGRRLIGATGKARELPQTNFAEMARAQGGIGHTIRCAADLQALDMKAICNHPGPTLLDVYIDPEEAPPMASRLRALAARS